MGGTHHRTMPDIRSPAPLLATCPDPGPDGLFAPFCHFRVEDGETWDDGTEVELTLDRSLDMPGSPVSGMDLVAALWARGFAGPHHVQESVREAVTWTRGRRRREFARACVAQGLLHERDTRGDDAALQRVLVGITADDFATAFMRGVHDLAGFGRACALGLPPLEAEGERAVATQAARLLRRAGYDSMVFMDGPGSEARTVVVVDPAPARVRILDRRDTPALSWP